MTLVLVTLLPPSEGKTDGPVVGKNQINSDEVLYSDFDSNAPTLDGENMAIMELICNIPYKLAPIAIKKAIALVLKRVGVTKPPVDRLSLLHNFKEFSHTILIKSPVHNALESVFIAALSFALSSASPSSDAVSDKDPHRAYIPVSNSFVDISDFTMHDDFIPIRLKKSRKNNYK